MLCCAWKGVSSSSGKDEKVFYCLLIVGQSNPSNDFSKMDLTK